MAQLVTSYISSLFHALSCRMRLTASNIPLRHLLGQIPQLRLALWLLITGSACYYYC